MKNNAMNHTELKQRVEQLKSQRTDKAELIKYNAKELYSSFDPVNIIKNNLSRIVNDSEIRKDAFSLLLNKPIRFISDKVFSGNKRSSQHSSNSSDSDIFKSVRDIITSLFGSR